MFWPRMFIIRFYLKLYATKRVLIQCAPLRVNVETSSTSWAKCVLWPKCRLFLAAGVVLWTEWYKLCGDVAW